MNLKVIPSGAVICSCSASLGVQAILTTPCVTNQTFIGIVPNENLSSEYLYFFLKSRTRYFKKVGTGTTIPYISRKKFEQLLIPELPVDGQIEVVKVLTKVETIIEKRKNQIHKLDEMIKARLVEMFGDIVLNPFKWDKDLLGVVCDVRDGTHDSPQYYETGFPLVTSKNVTGGKIDLTDCSLICKADYEKINERSKVDMGDIIMPMIGTVGKPVIVDIEPMFAIKNVALIKFRDNSRVLNPYVRALLQSDYFDDAVLSKVRGGTQKFISLGDIRKLEILVPPMERQQQFAALVTQVDKSKSFVQEALDEAQILFDSLMQKYFG